jgi:hypothetical protein
MKRGNAVPHYDRDADVREAPIVQGESVLDEDDAMDDAAQALRQAEVEAVQPDDSADKPASSKT